ncbi:MAG: RDD family protein [Gammaproteobacteria bacterium]|nr:RDD family protein [Gammaproteobacteria bacterium]MBU1724445.1 RDD family protein [Gammaproteobacteria bacterium]MBU2004167.1 RDD family protein [Gammaproteobacteria bacterium]
MNLNESRQPARAGGSYLGAPHRGGDVARNHYFTRAFPPYASVGVRLLSVAFDLMVVALLVLVSLVLTVADVAAVDIGSLWSGGVLLLVVCIPMLYFVVFWYLFGSSPGKMLLSLRVVDAVTQEEPTVLQCLLRCVGYLINVLSFGLGAVGIFDSRKPVGWHDRLSGTIIIQQ